MPKLNITQAAKAAGISRPTLYRHIKNGRVSVEKGANGETLIDLSELQRVYGELQSPDMPRDEPTPEKEHQTDTSAIHPAAQDHIDSLKEEVVALRHQLEEQEEGKKKLLEIVDRQTRMLIAPPPEAPVVASSKIAEEPGPHPAVEEMKDQVNRLSKQNNYLVHMQRRSWWEKLIGKKYVAPVDA